MLAKTEAEAVTKNGAEVMPRAPRLRSVLGVREDLSVEVIEVNAQVADVPVGLVAETMADAVAPEEAETAAPELPNDIALVHECFLEEMAAAHELFLRRFGGGVVATVANGGTDSSRKRSRRRHPRRSRWLSGSWRWRRLMAPALAKPEPVQKPASAVLPGPKFSREQLEHLASGKISEVFGPLFAGQDAFHRQVRMPMPPMLLADRVTGIDAVPGELGTGTIWTETDVRADSWYLHQGYVPMGITIESGQADLLLISWMGIDALNRSDRTYRLLGCEAEVKGPLPKVGDTLKFDIHIDGHAQLGGIRMFFFHYDLRVGDEVRLSVRHGQAGFFSDEELANSDGVIWDATTEPAPALRSGGKPTPPALTTRKAFSPTLVKAFSEGRTRECFGPGFELTETHSRTPRIQGRPHVLPR
jgi:hypothetical protein